MEPLTNPEKAALYERLRQPNAWDTCHKYGWIVTLIGTLVMQVVIWSYSIGSFKQRVDDLDRNVEQRIGRLEKQLDDLLKKY